jgi:GrpB-like predicted nucleotidyltransferase (UPF0157 family)
VTIDVVEYDPAWPGLAAAAIAELAPALRDAVTEIEHIGSTAVPGLAAKPTIDLMAAHRRIQRTIRRTEADPRGRGHTSR